MKSPSIRVFNNDDIPSALGLCRATGWNQLREDWSRLNRYEANGCFVAEIDSQIVGTVTTTRYQTDLAWIGMMLVHENYRRRGVGTALMTASLDYLRDQGVQCIKLDATPTGQRVYERLGFQAEGTFHRWCRDAGKGDVTQSQKSSASLTAVQLDLDRDAFGADRSRYLKRLARDSTVCVGPHGYGMRRPGYLANYLGPVIAENEAAASEIIAELLSQSPGKTFWDVPHGSQAAIKLAQKHCFTPVRDLTRMWTGSNVVLPIMNHQYAIADPGTG